MKVPQRHKCFVTPSEGVYIKVQKNWDARYTWAPFPHFNITLCACTVPWRGEQRDFETQLIMQSFWKTLGTTSDTSQMPPVHPLILYPLNVRDIYIYIWGLQPLTKSNPKSIKVDSTSVAVGFIIVPSDHPKITLLLPRQGVLFSSWMAMHHGIFRETTCKERRAILFMYMIYDNCWNAQITL